MKGSPRICARLPQESFDRLQRYCQEACIDLSHTVRQAIDAYLAPGPNGSQTAKLVGPPPDSVLSLCPKYRGWSGDLRKHLADLAAETLAASFICKLHYPRTPGMVEGYQGLRQLASFFGIKD